MKALAEVDFEFTEDDFDEALWKFVKVCHDFELRQLGPAGWSGFTASTLTPAEFREMMKRTFGLKLSPKELGALVTYFQKEFTVEALKKRLLNCQFFLNCFVQARVSTEAMKGKKNEIDLMVEYKDKLKFEYRERRDKSGSTMDARRPWRATATVRKGPGGAISMKQVLPYPESPEQKFLVALLQVNLLAYWTLLPKNFGQSCQMTRQQDSYRLVWRRKSGRSPAKRP